jgi:hypothetical protein
VSIFDGLDFEVFQNLEIRPRVICIEVNAGYRPESDEILPREHAAARGQPMHLFMDIARRKGYALVCYNGQCIFCAKRSVPNKPDCAV